MTKNLADREPQPTDGPDYHADHAAWVARQPKIPEHMVVRCQRNTEPHEFCVDHQCFNPEPACIQVGCMARGEHAEHVYPEDFGSPLYRYLRHEGYCRVDAEAPPDAEDCICGLAETWKGSPFVRRDSTHA